MKTNAKKGGENLPAVSILGTGKMGGAMARRLEEGGFPVSVWDRTRSRAEALGVGHVADSPGDAVRAADVVISMVTGPQAVRDIYFGTGGVLAAAAHKTIVEMSTAGPEVALELANAVADSGATLIEAPVIGSTPAVKNGTLVILAAADVVDDLAAARPVLQRLGEVYYVGLLGSAAPLKLVVNSFQAIISAAAAELISAGTRVGVGAGDVFEVLTRVAPGLKVREAGFVNHVHQPAMFAMRDMLKDLDLALELYLPDRGPTSTVPLTALTREMYARTASLDPGLDMSAITNAYSADAKLG